MTVETARLLLVAILAAGGLVWLLALRAHRRAFGGPDPRRPDLLREGETEVGAPPGIVRDRLVGALRSAGLAGVGPVRLEEARDGFVAGLLHVAARPGRAAPRPLRFEVSLLPGGGGTLAEWRISGTPGAGLGRVSGLFVYLLAPGALAAAGILLGVHVVPDGDPRVRLQAIQALQTVHFLWPPFLFAHVRRRMGDAVEVSLTTLLRNAAF